MSKPLKIFLLTTVLSATVPVAGAADYRNTYPMNPQGYGTATPKVSESYGTTIGKKVGAGFSNLALGFLEIPKNVVNTTNESNLALGVTGGVLKGVLHMAGRTLCGVVDVLSFPAPTEPLTTPQFVWMHFPQETRYNPAFKLKP